MYVGDPDNTPISSGESAPDIEPQSSDDFPVVRALVAGFLALFIGSAVYWQVWLWGSDGTTLPPLIAGAPMLLVAPEYVIGRRTTYVGLLVGAVAGVVGYLVTAARGDASGVLGAMLPSVIAVGGGWLVFCLAAAVLSQLAARVLP